MTLKEFIVFTTIVDNLQTFLKLNRMLQNAAVIVWHFHVCCTYTRRCVLVARLGPFHNSDVNSMQKTSGKEKGKAVTS